LTPLEKEDENPIRNWRLAVAGRGVVGAAAVIALIFSGCGDSGAEEESTGSSGGDGDRAAVVSELEAVEALDEEFLLEVDSLQLGIDLVVEDETLACMKAQGFEYVADSRSELARNLGMADSGAEPADDQPITDHFASARAALDGLIEYDESADPNAAYLSSLSDEEREVWALAQGECIAESSRKHPNPLASETNWYGLAVDEAASRTASSPEVVVAEQEFEQCFSSHGFGAPSEIHERYFDEVDAAARQFRAGEVDEATTRATLESIAEAELEISIAYEECDQPRREVVDRVYAEEFVKVAERDNDKVAIWAAEFKDSIDRYLTRLESP
jgi:hypothetical protein